jgi:hypothetical protein
MRSPFLSRLLSPAGTAARGYLLLTVLRDDFLTRLGAIPAYLPRLRPPGSR